jgi:hypothetical protein
LRPNGLLSGLPGAAIEITCRRIDRVDGIEGVVELIVEQVESRGRGREVAQDTASTGDALGRRDRIVGLDGERRATGDHDAVLQAGIAGDLDIIGTVGRGHEVFD